MPAALRARCGAGHRVPVGRAVGRAGVGPPERNERSLQSRACRGRSPSRSRAPSSNRPWRSGDGQRGNVPGRRNGRSSIGPAAIGPRAVANTIQRLRADIRRERTIPLRTSPAAQESRSDAPRETECRPYEANSSAAARGEEELRSTAWRSWQSECVIANGLTQLEAPNAARMDRTRFPRRSPIRSEVPLRTSGARFRG